MTHSTPTSASIPIELTLNLTGTYQPAMRAPAHMGEPPTEPDDPECVEDIVIEAVLFETHESCEAMKKAGRVSRAFITHDLLTGVDTSNPHVVRLLDNMLALVYREAEEALIEEARG